MIILSAAVIGILLGLRTARQRGGRPIDQWHYGAAYGIAFAVIGVIVTVIVSRVA